MSDAPMIYAKVAAVMADCDHVAKRDRNEHQKFLFRGIDAVVNAVGPILRKHGVVVVPSVQSVTYDSVQTSTGKPVTACRVLADYIFYAEDGSSITTRVAAEAFDSGDKAAPKAMSVAFRTALLQALALPTDEADPDSQVYTRDAAPRQARPSQRPRSADTGEVMSDTTRKRMFAMFTSRGITDRDLQVSGIEYIIGHTITSRGELTESEARAVCDTLEAHAAEKPGESA